MNSKQENTPFMNCPLDSLLEVGFRHEPKEDHHGLPVPDRFHYLYRKHGRFHQYVSLMYFYHGDYVPNNPVWGRFLEASLEVYWEPKNTRKPKGQLPSRELELKGFKTVGGSLYRDKESLLKAVAETDYELSPEPKKK